MGTGGIGFSIGSSKTVHDLKEKGPTQSQSVSTLDNHTQLKGAVIASQGDVADNRLDTGTLGFTDIGNATDYKVSHSGGSIAMSNGGTMAHAVWGAVSAQMSGGNAAAGAAGAFSGELATRYIAEKYWGADTPEKIAALKEDDREQLSLLGTLAAGLAGGMTGNSSAAATTGAIAGKNAVENNYLSQKQQAQKDKEIAECQTVACKADAQAKWTAIDLGQDGSFAAGMIAGVPAGLYDTIDSIVKTASNLQETYEALKPLFNSGDVLDNVSDAVKQSYIDRIDRMEAEYQKAGASGSFNAGVEGGKLVTDIVSLAAGGAGIARGGAVLTEKIAVKVAAKTEQAATKLPDSAWKAGEGEYSPKPGGGVTDVEYPGGKYDGDSLPYKDTTGIVGNSEDYTDILSPEAKQHIRYGDSSSSGGHIYPGNPGKARSRLTGLRKKLSMK
jgi:hypothetical protein